jgi:hypothetical protein
MNILLERISIGEFDFHSYGCWWLKYFFTMGRRNIGKIYYIRQLVLFYLLTFEVWIIFTTIWLRDNNCMSTYFAFMRPTWLLFVKPPTT